MKPDPYIPPMPRELTDAEKLYLRIAREGAFRLHGPENFRTARGLQKIGLGIVTGNMFDITPAGRAAIAEPTPRG